MHFSTLFTSTLLLTADGALAYFKPRPDMALAVPRAALPHGNQNYNVFGRRSVTFGKRTEHLKDWAAWETPAAAAAETPGATWAAAAAAAATPGAGQTGGATPGPGDKVQVVQVGGSNGSLTFEPADIKAEMGSFVQFQFNPMNHSVVQSTFDAPCMPMSISMPNASANAFFSGFMPAALANTASAASNGTSAASSGSTVGGKLTYTIKVSDAKPIWFYCSQGKHCQAGMVGAINAASTGQKTLAGYKQLAAAAAENLSPGQIPSAQSGNGTASGSSSSSDGSSSSSSSGSSGSSSGSSGAEAGAAASGTDSSLPAQQTTNAGPRVAGDVASSSALSAIVALGVAAMALL
ncbi:Extracellular serine-rich protein [Lasiodiplodia theobromae]|uniref:Extracellular serine-rich protein n=1 Tax=Lasiodiplodia theobromae TaxID=45133 RepID=UPI0015C30427|nr:Extracellular serine-rich protein [Lasiodiplodia theobromae]KAF4535581.1 Extracellular serine-rich protein [Lasiodiplodia theobromae]